MLKRTNTLINKKYMEFFVPTVLTCMANSIAMMVDSTIVNLTIGKDAFAAVNLMSPIIQLYVAISILFGMSAATIIAQIKGEDGTETTKCNTSFTVAMIMLGFVSVILILLQFVFMKQIVGMLTSDPTLQSLVRSYYIPLIIGTPITLIMTGGVYLIRTDGRPKFASGIITVANVVNLVMDLVLILICHLGITGASIATVTGNFVGLLMFLSHFRRKDNSLHFSIRLIENAENFFKHLKALLTYGVSGSLGAVLITIRLFFINGLVQRYGGAEALVAFSVVSLCQILASAFVGGACQTMVPVAGMLYGEKDHGGVRIALFQTFKILIISNLLIMLMIEIFAVPIVTLYGMTDALSLVIGYQALRIFALMFPADAMTFLWLYYFISVGKNGVSTSISVVNGVAIVIPLGLILPKMFGLTGVWLSLTVAQYLSLLYALICVLILKYREQKKNATGKVVASNEEIISFSLNGVGWSDELQDEARHQVDDVITNRQNDVEVYDEVDRDQIDKRFDRLSKCFEILAAAPLEKHRKSVDTDVRICTRAIIVKNSGPDVTEKDFSDSDVTFSKVLGLNQIVIGNS